MAGRGPQPKDVSKRARSNAEPVPIRVLPAVLADQPDLPQFDVTTRWRDKDSGEFMVETSPYVWADQTVVWWQMWRDSPLSSIFTSTDWSELLDTAILHSEFWKGDFRSAPELRLRTAKFGATPEDRARLRIQFAEADGAEITTAQRRRSIDRFASVSVTSMDPDVAS